MAGRGGYVIEVSLHMSKPLHEQAPSEARQQTKTKTDSKREPRDSSGQVRKPNAATYGSHMANQLECSEVDFGSRTRVLLRTEGRSDPPLGLHAVAVGRAPQPLILQVIGMKPHSLQT